jgi:large subunit ribosomal protein L25
MKQHQLTVTPREGTGRSASRRLRKQDRVPAILYGKHTAPVTLSVDGPEFARLVKAIGDNAALIELEGVKEQTLSILQEVQRDAMTDQYMHIDLHEVKADEKMEINVPVHLSGESTGAKNEAGVLEMASHRIRVRCLPKDLPAFIDVDVTELHVGQTIHLSEVKKVPNVVFLGDKDLPVVSCVQPVEEIVEVTPEVAVPVEGVPVEGVPVEGAAAPGTAPVAGAVPVAGAAPAAAGAKPGAPGAKPGALGAKPGAAVPAAGAKGAFPGAAAGKPGAPGAKPGAPAAKAPPARK